MTITNPGTGTRIDEVTDRIYRISTPVKKLPGGFSFNQYLIDDDEPLLFHTGPRKLFPLVREAIGRVMPVERLRHIGFSHFEADECGSLNEFLAVAPGAAPLCGKIAALVSVNDIADRKAGAMEDGEVVRLGAGKFNGSTRRTCRMHGSAVCCSNARRTLCCAATCSPRVARTIRRSPKPTSSSRASISANRWTTTRTPRMRGRSWRVSPKPNRRRLRVCMAALGAAMAPKY